MTQVKQINIKQIFEKATGRKITDDDLQRRKLPIALGPAPKSIAGNLGQK